MLDYTNPNFDIVNIPSFNNVDGLPAISSYLDFALANTIRRQIPNPDQNMEKKYATEILTEFLKGDFTAFTRIYNIRQNMEKITPETTKNLMLHSLIELEAENKVCLQQLQPTEFIDQCAEYVTNVIARGRLDELQDWISDNMGAFIQNYVQTRYKESPENKKSMNEMAIEYPDTQRALQQLNLEIHEKKIRHTR